jgi:hypothetical protein
MEYKARVIKIELSKKGYSPELVANGIRYLSMNGTITVTPGGVCELNR